MLDNIFGTVTELVKDLRSKRVSASELVEAAIARIERYDSAINAVIVRDFENARTAAKDADKALTRGETGELLGIPMTVKESFDVSGLSKTWGMEAAKNTVSEQDAVVTQRLKKAGAIILGKTNVPENLGDWQTMNNLYGVTNNPWDVTRTSGGSSGGASASVAAGFVPLEFGSDLNGSLRIPAHFCGVFAHNPTFGIVPTRGHKPPGSPNLLVSSELDFAVVGPIARCSEDLALALKVVVGPDQDESLGYKLNLPPSRHTKLSDFRVLLITEHPLAPLSADIENAIERCVERLGKTGCTISRSSKDMPDLSIIGHSFLQMMTAMLFTDVNDETFKNAQEMSAHLPASDTSPFASYVRGQVLTHRDYVRLSRIQSFIKDQWFRLFRNVDVVICPAAPVTAIKHDHGPIDQRRILVNDKEVDYGELGLWNPLATFTGQPATTVPIAFSENGLPIGMQIIGPRFEDNTTLRFAKLLEKELGGFRAPKML